ncbi:tetraacyldisaccharide 4'-kinase [Candidatus Babeliales bacterium]|nr:tetraacyldisaccharide 4'-kinase [Candidatus Babeliales bacterium]
MRNVLERIWQKTSVQQPLTPFEKLIFCILCLLEPLYRAGFFIVACYRKKTGNKPVSFNVISVGNLSVGGTGKSVVVSFLGNLLVSRVPAIVLRGYGGSAAKQGVNVLVSDGKAMLCSAEISGDEAFMLAQSFAGPVVVGADRLRSCQLLEAWSKKTGNALKTVILDDAYQNYKILKSVEILLLDARKPFDNTHTLPAGRLREKDYRRAHFFFLTHADEVSTTFLQSIKTDILTGIDQKFIFAGKHAYAGIFFDNVGFDQTHNLSGQRCLVVAGIGSISGFEQTVANAGLVRANTLEFQDHHAYSVHDLEVIEKRAQSLQCFVAVTTAKDWVKLQPLIQEKKSRMRWYVVRVTFAFLQMHDEQRFSHELAKFLDHS